MKILVTGGSGFLGQELLISKLYGKKVKTLLLLTFKYSIFI